MSISATAQTSSPIAAPIRDAGADTVPYEKASGYSECSPDRFRLSAERNLKVSLSCSVKRLSYLERKRRYTSSQLYLALGENANRYGRQ